ncbi:MAG: hypothetical protein RMJ60_01085, partial [Anaerolineales bacterium]|nr:hypothetical protein [Anaerolineales bacterium]
MSKLYPEVTPLKKRFPPPQTGKGTAHFKGYVVNVAETCDPQNPLQLITKVQVAPNNTTDVQLLNEALPNLKERTEPDTPVTDGAHASAQNDADLHRHNVQLLPIGLRGTPPDPTHCSLADFEI